MCWVEEAGSDWRAENDDEYSKNVVGNNKGDIRTDDQCQNRKLCLSSGGEGQQSSTTRGKPGSVGQLDKNKRQKNEQDAKTKTGGQVSPGFSQRDPGIIRADRHADEKLCGPDCFCRGTKMQET